MPTSEGRWPCTSMDPLGSSPPVHWMGVGAASSLHPLRDGRRGSSGSRRRPSQVQPPPATTTARSLHAQARLRYLPGRSPAVRAWTMPVHPAPLCRDGKQWAPRSGRRCRRHRPKAVALHTALQSWFEPARRHWLGVRDGGSHRMTVLNSRRISSSPCAVAMTISPYYN